MAAGTAYPVGILTVCLQVITHAIPSPLSADPSHCLRLALQGRGALLLPMAPYFPHHRPHDWALEFLPILSVSPTRLWASQIRACV